MIDLFEIGCLSVKIKAEHLADDATKLFHSSPKISWSVCPLETVSARSNIWTKDGACLSKVTDSYVLNCNIRIVPKCLKSKNALAYPFDIDEEISLHQKPTLLVLHSKGSTWTNYEHDSQILDYIVSVWQ